MSQRIEVRRAGFIAHPQPFLTCGFETRIVTLALCTQGVCSLETEAKKGEHTSKKIDIVAHDNRGFTFGFATGMGYRRSC